ncbi:hypothetical protein WME79_45990 [Sorangium sp. So ce726]|uniref:hypothetical protein n=1 Tax=Sorangium sp. So ce726 TaxID=3133319 RepID=UPI003F622195
MIKRQSITTKITLTDQQRSELASALNIDVQYVPQELGVVGIPRDEARLMGIPEDMKGRFSPALIMA